MWYKIPTTLPIVAIVATRFSSWTRMAAMYVPSPTLKGAGPRRAGRRMGRNLSSFRCYRERTQIKVRDGEGTVTNTRGACAPQQDGKTIYFTNCVQKERTARMVRPEPQPLS